jgi:hypothetical protein
MIYGCSCAGPLSAMLSPRQRLWIAARSNRRLRAGRELAMTGTSGGAARRYMQRSTSGMKVPASPSSRRAAVMPTRSSIARWSARRDAQSPCGRDDDRKVLQERLSFRTGGVCHNGGGKYRQAGGAACARFCSRTGHCTRPPPEAFCCAASCKRGIRAVSSTTTFIERAYVAYPRHYMQSTQDNVPP